MAERQELLVRQPDLAHDVFYIRIEGKTFQPWERNLSSGEELEFFVEEEERWQRGILASSYIDDGSGNAPGVSAHFFMKWEDAEGLRWRYTLEEGVRIRVEAPMVEELVARSKCVERE